jgi:hypothetical protein
MNDVTLWQVDVTTHTDGEGNRGVRYIEVQPASDRKEEERAHELDESR